MSAAGLAARLAGAARATAARRRVDSPGLHSVVAVTASSGFAMCHKPYAIDAEGAVMDVCSSKPAHHRGDCGPWMPWDGQPRDHDGEVIPLDDVDFGRFPTAEELDELRSRTRGPDRNAPYDCGARRERGGDGHRGRRRPSLLQVPVGAVFVVPRRLLRPRAHPVPDVGRAAQPRRTHRRTAMSVYERRARIADWIGWVFLVVGVLWLVAAVVKVSLGEDSTAAVASALTMSAICLAMRAHGANELLRGRVEALELAVLERRGAS